MVTLKWYGPFSFRSILTDQAFKDRFRVPGVYLWTETLPGGEKQLSYIGKATRSTTLWGRHLQHYASLVGGLYNIPGEFTDSKEDWIPDWSKETVATTMLDMNRFMKVVEAGFARAEVTEIYLCPLPESVNLEHVERQLLYDLKPTGTKKGTISPPKLIVKLEHSNTPWKTS